MRGSLDERIDEIKRQVDGDVGRPNKSQCFP